MLGITTSANADATFTPQETPRGYSSSSGAASVAASPSPGSPEVSADTSSAHGSDNIASVHQEESWLDRVVLAPEIHASFLSDVADRSTLNDTVGYGGRIGYRIGDWGAYVLAEQNLWGTSENQRKLSPGVFNLGLGGEVLIFNGRVRVSGTGGISVLLFDTLLDQAGTVGMFAEVRPGGLRWPLARGTWLEFDPLTLAVAAPVLGGIPLIQLEYRTMLALEFVGL